MRPDMSVTRTEELDARPFGIVLTVADHAQNGFVALAEWTGFSEAEARAIISSIDAQISDESEPDSETAAFAFILDLVQGYDTLDNGRRLLPTQVAMSLAPGFVQRWLDRRPNPDCMIGFPVPRGDIACLRAQASIIREAGR